MHESSHESPLWRAFWNDQRKSLLKFGLGFQSLARALLVVLWRLVVVVVFSYIEGTQKRDRFVSLSFELALVLLYYYYWTAADTTSKPTLDC